MPARRRLAPGGVLAIGAAIAVSVASCGSPATSSPAAGSPAASSPAASSPAAYQIRTPPLAGGWKISASGPGGLTVADIAASPLQLLVFRKARHARAAFYTDPVTGIQVLFGGASGPLGNPADLIARLRADPGVVTTHRGVVVTWHEVAPGPHGGRAACGEISPSQSPGAPLPFCAWQTTTTFGLLTELDTTPVGLGMTVDGLASRMRRMRPDLETTA
jgi:hypothetical protein